MRRIYHLVIFACIAVLCSTAPAFATAYYPDGLNGPSSIERGLYPADNPTGCCWMARDAVLRVDVPAGARALVLRFFIPDYAAPAGGQSLRVAIGNGPWQRQCCFIRGMHEVALPLPAGVARRDRVSVRLQAGAVFVPAKVGLNADPRKLSVLLRGVGFVGADGGVMLRQAQHDSGTLALLLLLGVAIAVATWKRPVSGVVALIVTDPFLLAYGVHGTTVTLPKVALLAVAAALVLRPASERRGLLWTALAVLLGAQALFAASMALSSLHPVASHGAALRETLKAWEYAATLLVAYVAYRRDPQELVLRCALSGLVVIVAGLALAQLFGGAPQGEFIAGHVFARIAGPLEGPNQFAGFLGVAIPAMLAFAVFRPPLTIERIAIVLGIIACVLTFSRGGVAALAFGIALVLLLRYAPRFERATAAAACCALALALAIAIGVFAGVMHGPVAALFGGADGDTYAGGLGSRADLWHGAYQMWRAHPLLGVGPGNYELLIGSYDPGVRTHANSIFFNVLAEQGIIGFGALLLLVVASIAAFVRRLNEPFAVAGCAVVFALALHQVVDSMWIYPKVGILFWALIAVAAAHVDATLAEPVFPAERIAS